MTTQAIQKPYIQRTGSVYDVIGKSGTPAGLVSRVSKTRGWIMWMHGSPKEHFESFATAKQEALKQAERY